MKRVGIFANTFEPVFGPTAGGHVHFVEVAKRWHGVEIYVFAPNIARDFIARELPDAHFVSMQSCDRFISNLQLRNLARVLLSFRRRSIIRSCDVLLATSHFLPDLVPALFAPKRMAVCVHHVIKHSTTRPSDVIPNAISAALQALSLALIHRFAPIVFVHTADVANGLNFDRKRTRIVLMRNGIEHLKVGGTGAAAPKCDALYLGRLVPAKGTEDLLVAWATVVRALPTAQLTIAGGGPSDYVRHLEKLVVSHGLLQNVRFTGRVSDEEKVSLFASASCFVFPSKEEGWGIVLAEAMSYGLPCVTYDLPAFRHDFVGGRLVAPISDPVALAQHIIRLLSDGEYRKVLSSEARALARTFSWDAAAEIEYRALEALAS